MKIITALELKKRLDGDEVSLIDVREPIEHKNASIEGACLIPLSEINITKLPSRARPIVIYCRSGQRSANACMQLLESEPSLDVYNLEGGIIAWQQAGFNVKKANLNLLPLDRQTQIAVGSIAFIGTILGSFVNPAFYILPAIIGAGLIFAGLTGHCGMAMLLARMPWNK